MDILSTGGVVLPQPIASERSKAETASSTAKPAAPSVEANTTVQQPSPDPSLDQVKDAVKQINESASVKDQNIVFGFDIDDKTKRAVVTVTDKATNEVIRQLPSKEALEISRALEQSMEKIQGVLIDQKA